MPKHSETAPNRRRGVAWRKDCLHQSLIFLLHRDLLGGLGVRGTTRQEVCFVPRIRVLATKCRENKVVTGQVVIMVSVSSSSSSSTSSKAQTSFEMFVLLGTYLLAHSGLLERRLGGKD